MAAEEGDRLTDENCRGYPTWEISQAERERKTNLTLFSGRLQRGFRWNFLFFFNDMHQRMKVKPILKM